MSLVDFLSDLRSTETWKANLLRIQEYTFESKWFGLSRALPNVPTADKNNHIIILEVQGNRPVIRTVLSDPTLTVNVTSKDVDKIIFLFVKVNPQHLDVNSPSGGYQLGDGEKITVSLDITYRVTDAGQFFTGSEDPLSTLKRSVVNEARNYFTGVSTDDLLDNFFSVKKNLEEQIQTLGVRVIRVDETRQQKSQISGIQILEVQSDIEISEDVKSLHEKERSRRHFLRNEVEVQTTLRKRQAEQLEHRKKVDMLIDNDTTFAPYKLRDVIIKLDFSLLDNFYNLDWNTAMKKVYDEFSLKKKEYFEDREMLELKKLKQRLDMAKELELDEMDIQEIKERIANKLLTDSEEDDKLQFFSDDEFVQLLIGTSASVDKRLGSSRSVQKKITVSSDFEEEG